MNLFMYPIAYKLSLKQKLEFIKEQIENNNYIVLPDTISINTVYKINYTGNLNYDGYELGFLFIPNGSGIKEHTHLNDIEQYKLLSGSLSVKGIISNSNQCLISDSHNIDVVNEDTFIETYKINKQFISEKYQKTKKLLQNF